jgi:hypothetical protein
MLYVLKFTNLSKHVHLRTFYVFSIALQIQEHANNIKCVLKVVGRVA